MLVERTFRVELVGREHGTGIGASATAEATVTYKGEKLVVKR
jgi:hypothetical protein